MKSHFPVKWIVSLDAISNEIALSYEVCLLVSNEVALFLYSGLTGDPVYSELNQQLCIK